MTKGELIQGVLSTLDQWQHVYSAYFYHQMLDGEGAPPESPEMYRRFQRLTVAVCRIADAAKKPIHTGPVERFLSLVSSGCGNLGEINKATAEADLFLDRLRASIAPGITTAFDREMKKPLKGNQIRAVRMPEIPDDLEHKRTASDPPPADLSMTVKNPKESETVPKSGKAKVSLDDRATAMLTRWLKEGHSGISKRALARGLECHHSSLNNCPTFLTLLRASKGTPDRGFVDGRTGKVEATGERRKFDDDGGLDDDE